MTGPVIRGRAGRAPLPLEGLEDLLQFRRVGVGAKVPHDDFEVAESAGDGRLDAGAFTVVIPGGDLHDGCATLHGLFEGLGEGRAVAVIDEAVGLAGARLRIEITIAWEGDGDSGSSLLGAVTVEFSEFGCPCRLTDCFSFADGYPGEGSIDVWLLPEVGQGERERIIFKRRPDRGPFWAGEELWAKDKEHWTTRDTDVSGVAKPMPVGPGERSRDPRDGLGSGQFLFLDEALSRIVFDTKRELQASFLEFRD